ncbi:hypothetical protein RR46_01870 [Papilio xuthus]|uniref:Uncharacterized protein n=1 Tax=Papilio xuthus TaxID=66420 RepID=A0A194QEF2_PAPXU|nr:hypothetical protein RR46_01870 [Papilio xuthus]
MVQEEKSAREAAVWDRRRALEAARLHRVHSLVQRRRLLHERAQGMRDLRRQERDDAAREKAEGVKSRLSALAAAAEQEADALRSRIRDKQDASQQRLEQHLQAVREKATGPRQPDEWYWYYFADAARRSLRACALRARLEGAGGLGCVVVVDDVGIKASVVLLKFPGAQNTTSESHEQNEEEEAKRYEQERREREKQKNIKKKARKLRLRLLNTSHNEDQIPTYDHIGIPFGNKMFKVIQQISNIITPLCDEQDTTKQNGDNDEKTKNKKVLNGDVDKQTDKQNGIENNNNTDIKIIKEKVESKKKKKKKDGDGGKENAKNNAPSVCSSQSDTSRSSKKETKLCVTFDQVLLERNLNELYRMIEKIDKFYPEVSVSGSVSAQKMYGLRAVGHMLALASQREDLAAHFTAKSLCTGVALVSVCAGACGSLAARLLRSPVAEKNLQDDNKETELARYLSDCLSVALDSVLCATRLYEDGSSTEDPKAIGALRNRAHLIIR